MNGFLFNIDLMTDNIRNFLIEKFELNPDSTNLAIFETNEVESIEEFESYVKEKGFPKDIKIRILANCCIKSIEDEGTRRTSNISSISF